MRQAILVPGVARLPQFSSAVRSGDFLFLSGVLGTKPNSMELVEGGAGPETKQVDFTWRGEDGELHRTKISVREPG